MSLEYTKVTDDEGEVGKLLKKYFMPPYRKGYVRVGPEKVLLPEYYLEFADRIRDFEVRDDDVWVVSHPKTGTTWTQEMAWCIKKDLDYEGAKVPLPERFPFLELTSLFDFRENPSIFTGFETSLVFTNSVQYVAEKKSPRFIKTHLPWSLLPRQIQDGTKQAKIIYVCRNAKDTCVSYYHHCVLCEGFKGSLNDFCKMFLEDSVTFAPFWPHVLQFWERRDQPNILFLKYEDMKKDLPGVIRKTAEFLNTELTDKQVSSLTNHLSFENMKNNSAVNYEIFNNPDNADEDKGHFMRNGRVGDGEREMSNDLVRKFDTVTEEQLCGTGLVL